MICTVRFFGTLLVLLLNWPGGVTADALFFLRTCSALKQ